MQTVRKMEDVEHVYLAQVDEDHVPADFSLKANTILNCESKAVLVHKLVYETQL